MRSALESDTQRDALRHDSGQSAGEHGVSVDEFIRLCEERLAEAMGTGSPASGHARLSKEIMKLLSARLGESDRGVDLSLLLHYLALCSAVQTECLLDILPSYAVGSRPSEEAAEQEEGEDEQSIQIPEFRTRAELDAWWDSLPKVKAEVDPRLREKVKTSIRLSRMVIDGFSFLAKDMGLRSGQTLMKMVLQNYLAERLPPDF